MLYGYCYYNKIVLVGFIDHCHKNKQNVQKDCDVFWHCTVYTTDFTVVIIAVGTLLVENN